ERQIVGEIHDLTHLDPGRRLELVRGDDRAWARLDDVTIDPEILKLLLEDGGVGLELLARPAPLGRGRWREQADRRELERLGSLVAEVERFLPSEPLFPQARLRPRPLLPHPLLSGPPFPAKRALPPRGRPSAAPAPPRPVGGGTPPLEARTTHAALRWHRPPPSNPLSPCPRGATAACAPRARATPRRRRSA